MSTRVLLNHLARLALALSVPFVVFFLSPVKAASQQPPASRTPASVLAAREAASTPAAERLAKRRLLLQTALQAQVTQGAVTVRGRTDPELLLPLELFNELVVRALSPTETGLAQRREFDGAGRLLGMNQTHWSVLEEATADLRTEQARVGQSLAKQAQALARSGASSADVKAALREAAFSHEATICPLLREAFEQATTALGEAFLSRLLYEVIAPATSITFDVEPEGENRMVQEGLCT